MDITRSSPQKMVRGEYIDKRALRLADSHFTTPLRGPDVKKPRSQHDRGSGVAQRQTPFTRKGVCFYKAPGSDLLSHGLSHTTIGAGAFHFRVRDGIGWFPLAMVARQTGFTVARARSACGEESCCRLSMSVCRDQHQKILVPYKPLEVIWPSRTAN